MKDKITAPWSSVKPGYQVRINNVVWRVLSNSRVAPGYQGHEIVMEAPARGTKTGRPDIRTQVELVLRDDKGRLTFTGENYLHPVEEKQLHRARAETGILDEPKAQTPEGEEVDVDPAIESIAEEMGVDPHDVIVALFEVRLGGRQIFTRKGEGEIHCPPKDTLLLPDYRTHLFLFHGIYMEGTRASRKQLDEAHESPPNFNHIAHVHTRADQ